MALRTGIPRLSVAAGARPVEDEIVRLGPEAPGREPFECSRTCIHLEEPIAAAAEEVVMMSLSGPFVSIRRAGKPDGADLAAREHAADVAVDGRQPDAGRDAPRRSPDLLGGHRTTAPLDGIAHGPSLSRVTHGQMIIDYHLHASTDAVTIAMAR
jgi:hypothetical protein